MGTDWVSTTKRNHQAANEANHTKAKSADKRKFRVKRWLSEPGSLRKIAGETAPRNSWRMRLSITGVAISEYSPDGVVELGGHTFRKLLTENSRMSRAART